MQLIVVFILFISMSSYAGNEQEAIQQAALATYKQSGLEKNINQLIKDTVPKEYIELFEKISPAVLAITTKRVELKWNF